MAAGSKDDPAACSSILCLPIASTTDTARLPEAFMFLATEDRELRLYKQRVMVQQYLDLEAMMGTIFRQVQAPEVAVAGNGAAVKKREWTQLTQNFDSESRYIMEQFRLTVNKVKTKEEVEKAVLTSRIDLYKLSCHELQYHLQGREVAKSGMGGPLDLVQGLFLDLFHTGALEFHDKDDDDREPEGDELDPARVDVGVVDAGGPGPHVGRMLGKGSVSVELESTGFGVLVGANMPGAEENKYYRRKDPDPPRNASDIARDIILGSVPSISWMAEYKWRMWLKDDVLAGLTVGVMLVSQSMAYARLAGLQPVYGLYSSLVPIILYALFGTCRELGVGPVAIVSLLVGTALESQGVNGETNPVRYAESAFVLAFFTGVFSLLMGILRLGFVTNLLSHAVISGFTSAAAIIIGLTQAKDIFGLSYHRSHYAWEEVYLLCSHLPETHWQTLLMGIFAIAILKGVQFVNQRNNAAVPGPLVLVVVMVLLTWGARLDQVGVAIVGEIPEGLPVPTAGFLESVDVVSLLPTAGIVALLGFVESISISKKFGIKGSYKIDSNQELVALGIGNLVGSMFGAFPVSGSFSRSAVYGKLGMHTQVGALTSAFVIMMTLLLLTPLFYYLPKVALAAIVITAVESLIDVEEALYLWRVKRQDFFSLALAFVMTLALGVEFGLGIAVLGSLLIILLFAVRPPIMLVGRSPGTTFYTSVKKYPNVLLTPGILVARVDAAIYFVNCAFLEAKLKKLVTDYPYPVRCIVLDMRGVNDIDSTGTQTLLEIWEHFDAAGITIYFAQLNERVRKIMVKSGVAQTLIEKLEKSEARRRLAEVGGGSDSEQKDVETPGAAVDPVPEAQLFYQRVYDAVTALQLTVDLSGGLPAPGWMVSANLVDDEYVTTQNTYASWNSSARRGQSSPGHSRRGSGSSRHSDGEGADPKAD